MSDTKVVEDVRLIGICDQLSDAQLEGLAQCARDPAACPGFLEGELTDVAAGLLGRLFASPQGRRQVLDAVELERQAREEVA